MDIALIEGVSKFIYLLTVFWIGTVWWKTFCMRKLHPRLTVLFWVQSILAPLYSVLAVFYVLDIAYISAFGYLGWAIVNTLFISTDMMLVLVLARLAKGNLYAPGI